MICPLCQSCKTVFYIQDKTREYHRCSLCDLIFVPKGQLISIEAERARYDTHNNGIENKGYRDYLQSKIDDLKELGIDLLKGSILDFGAGKEAVMTHMLQEAGYDATAYDPMYGLSDLCKAPYHVIIMNEVIEHLYNPQDELQKVIELLDSEAYLYINTELTDNVKEFKNWWYRSDPTHVIFCSTMTFTYLAEKYNLELVDNNRKNRVLFRKK